MTGNEYQQLASRTKVSSLEKPISLNNLFLVVKVLQLSVLVGVLADNVKKGVFHGHGVKNEEIADAILGIANLLQTFDRQTVLVDIYPTEENIVKLWNGIGLIGESAETMNLLLEIASGKTSITDIDKLTKELGDIEWYTAAVASDHSINLDDVLSINIEKLKKRYPDGFKSEDSINRKDN